MLLEPREHKNTLPLYEQANYARLFKHPRERAYVDKSNLSYPEF